MLTPPDLAVQHAGWHPGGHRLVSAYALPGSRPVKLSEGKMFPQGIVLTDLPAELAANAHA
jgi:hypothetical protein